MVDEDEFRELTPLLPASRRRKILPPLQAAMARYAIDRHAIREAHFLAQLLHESGRFRYLRELASGRAYEGRTDLGNVRAGDGPRYKGRGWIQITGRANYRKYGALLGLPLEEEPELAATEEHAAFIAGAYWQQRGLNDLADRDDLLTITRRINGGLNGLADRRTCLAHARAVLSLDDPDVPSDDPEEPLRILLRGAELPFTAFLRHNTSWAPLRPLATALQLTILETQGPDATLQDAAGASHSVPIEITGGRGYSPVRAVGRAAGLSVRFANGSVVLE